MAHLIELTNAYNGKIILVNLDNVTDIIEQEDALQCRLTLNSISIDNKAKSIRCLESIEQIMCIAKATNPLNTITQTLQTIQDWILEQRKYNELTTKPD